MRQTKLVQILGSLTILALLISSFQNCSQTGQFSASEPMQKADLRSEANGNGHGYGGKLFVYLLPVGFCPDGSNIQAQIRFDMDGRSSLERENCQEVSARLVSVLMAADGRSIVFDGFTFTLKTLVTAPTPSPTAPIATPATAAPTPNSTPNLVPSYRNVVAGSKAVCESSIFDSYGINQTCTIGGGCSGAGGPPTSANPSANPTAWGACFRQ